MMMILSCVNRARRTGFVSFSAQLTFLTTPTTAPADSGIAARYPGDKNIASDPAVIFADDFESYHRANSQANGAAPTNYPICASQPSRATTTQAGKRWR